MYSVNKDSKTITKLNSVKFSELGVKERGDIQEWIDGSPEILGEDLLIIAKEYILPSQCRLDLLALDANANLVIIELKRDNSGSNIDWQAIKYASYCESLTEEDIYEIFAAYKAFSIENARDEIANFLNDTSCDEGSSIDDINSKQRIILVASEFHSDAASSVLWLINYGIDIQCMTIEPFIDGDGNLFINPTTIIPTPEAKDYIIAKGRKIREKEAKQFSTYSLEKGNFGREELEEALGNTFSIDSGVVPKVKTFIEILLSENKKFDRDTLKSKLFEANIGKDTGQAGRYLSNISQFITKKANTHLRQIIEFDSEGTTGSIKNNYYIVEEYRGLVESVLRESYSLIHEQATA